MKIKSTIGIVAMVAVVVLITMLSQCKLIYKDVSNQPDYAPLLHSRYTAKNEMYIFGVNLPPGYGDDINIYSVRPTERGRISGPEILSEDLLQSGTILEILSIKKSVNHLLPMNRSIKAVVSVTSFKKKAQVPIVIDLKYLQSTNYVNKL